MVFWLLALISVGVTGGVIAQWPIADLLPEAVLSEVPVVSLDSGTIGVYFLGGLFVSVTPLHRALHYSATVVHELGHAFVTGLLGGRPKEIEIHPSGSGVATYEAPVLWARWRRVAVTAAGYPAPAVAGLAGVLAATNGLGALWVVFTASVLTLSVVLIIRNFWGFFWSAGVLALAYVGVTRLSAEQVALFGVAMSGFLLTEAMRDSREQITIVRRVAHSGADAERVADWYGISRTFVAVLQFLTVAAVAGLGVWRAVVTEWGSVFGELEALWVELRDYIDAR